MKNSKKDLKIPKKKHNLKMLIIYTFLFVMYATLFVLHFYFDLKNIYSSVKDISIIKEI